MHPNDIQELVSSLEQASAAVRPENYCVIFTTPLPHEVQEDTPMEVFLCEADSVFHAERQCVDAYPTAQIYRTYVEA
mgnify:CR=1 FL=1